MIRQSLQFDAVGEINRYGNPFLAQSVEEWILECMPLTHIETSLLFVLIIIVCTPFRFFPVTGDGLIEAGVSISILQTGRKRGTVA